jgi:hypothetical protein
MKHEEKNQSGSSRSPIRAFFRQLRALFRAETAGQSFVEYLVVAGFCALVGVFGFKQYGSAVERDLVADAKHIEGEGLPNTENLLSSLGVDYNAPPGWCVKPNYCFAAGTLVETESGDRPIERIAIGERVWARDVSTGARALRPVLNTFVTAGVPVVELELFSNARPSERLRVTPGHRFWVESLGWVRADALGRGAPGERLLWSTEAPLSASIVSEKPAPTTVYNLEVAEFHSYFVGQNHVLVHNGNSTGDVCPEVAPVDPPPPEDPIEYLARITCGESGTYKDDLGGGFRSVQQKTNRPSGTMQRDHVPSTAAQVRRAQKLMAELREKMMSNKCRDLTPEEQDQLEAAAEKALKDLGPSVQDQGFAVVEPGKLHGNTRTYQQTPAQAEADSEDLQAAAQADIAKIRELLQDPAYRRNLQNGCAEKILAALAPIENKTNADYDQALTDIARAELEKAGFSSIIESTCP